MQNTGKLFLSSAQLESSYTFKINKMNSTHVSSAGIIRQSRNLILCKIILIKITRMKVKQRMKTIVMWTYKLINYIKSSYLVCLFRSMCSIVYYKFG